MQLFFCLGEDILLFHILLNSGRDRVIDYMIEFALGDQNLVKSQIMFWFMKEQMVGFMKDFHHKYQKLSNFIN